MELFFHRAPEGYEYFIDSFNSTTKRIWIINNRFDFVYMEGKSVWGFYNPNPVNHKKIGGIRLPISTNLSDQEILFSYQQH